MGPQASGVSRRCFLAGVAGAAFGLPPDGRAQTTSDGFRLLRARALGAGQTGQSASSVLRYDGTMPGPTLRARRGDEFQLRLVNDLAEPTSVHWHGVRLPNAMDGVPPLTQPIVAPGATFDYRFRPRDAGTFWYHAPAARHIDQGLHGALIVEETEPVDVDRDVVLVFDMPAEGSPAPVLVNGALRPDIAVTSGERLRLRLINATAARGLALKLESHAPWVMAIDGQPAEPFLARESRVGLGPGNRVDLFVDTLREAGTVAALVAGPDEQPIARLVYKGDSGARTSARGQPRPLPPNPLPAHIDLRNSLKTELALTGGKPLEAAGPPLFAVGRGRAVTLAIRNAGSAPQVVHLHGHHVRLLDRLDDGWKPYWMDTLVVGDEVARVAFVADNPGKWLIEWRTLERRDSGAAVWFAVS